MDIKDISGLSDNYLNLYQIGYKAGRDDAEYKYKEKLYGVYCALILAFGGDKESLKKIDQAFGKPMEEAKK